MTQFSVDGRNVNHTMIDGMKLMLSEGVPHKSRVGEVIEILHPVISCYRKPRERMCYYPERDANPYFHIFEALWMLVGTNDVKWLERFNPRMLEFSDDGQTLNGAYGKRWRSWFGYDQIDAVITNLKNDKGTRRAVVAIWDGHKDLTNTKSKDLPCNISVIFQLRHGKLQMTVNNRSNDMLWGAYGANVVHFSFLQEYVADMIGAEVGEYFQISNNLHVYTNKEGYPLEKCKNITELFDPYQDNGENFTYSKKLVEDAANFMNDLQDFMETAHTNQKRLFPATNSWFTDVAYPMLESYNAFKAKDYPKAFQELENVLAPDIQLACKMWLDRRYQKFLIKKSV